MLSVRVVTVDYYITKPIKYLKKQKSDDHWLEPVIRIFGPTSDGVKTCVHIHGVYPYMYVPYRGGEHPERDALLLGAALDQALAANSNAKNPKFIYKVILTSGIPLYGYHSKPRQFFKVYFFNPYHIKKASHLLLSGAILGQRFQPHEAHIPFTLQFMMDYNIYGMSFITLEKVKYRRSPSNPGSLKGVEKNQIQPQSVKRITYSYWEVDALAEDILNVRSSRGVASVNPGLQAIWEDEKNRRRAQDRTSQITPQTSLSRPETLPTANELMHKQRLAQKLQNVVLEAEEVAERETPFSYPAEVPEDAMYIPEASFIGTAEMNLPSQELLEDMNNLINEKILTQMMQNEESESEGEQAKIDDDSVLGRNQRDDDEAELQDENGGDMTQPLEMLENVISGDYQANRDERGDNYDREDEFWKSMAEKIMQLDGADDISSLDSDEENRRSIGHSQFLSKADDGVSRILESNSSGSESITNWSNNIMSILTDSSGFPTQQVYQTSQNFWSNWSPKVNPSEAIWPQNNADSWTWDKSDSVLLDCLVKSGKSGEESFQPQTGDAVNHPELYGFPSGQGEYFHGNYTPTSTMSPISNVGSVYNISPPSAILTPCSEMDSYSDVNLDSISQISNSPSPQEDLKPTTDRTQIVETKTVTVPRADVCKSTLKSKQQDLIDLLRKFSESRKSPEQADSKVKMVATTLQQYIKTCGEIMNVDFKNLSGKEMIIIEYKPVNSKSNQNKYLIKPLDKFLEDWNSMEKLNNSQAKAEDAHWPRLINGFALAANNTEEEKQLSAILNTLENKYTGNWLDESKIKSIKNKFVVKSIEMLPDSECVTGKVVKNDADKTYKVNKNVISDGKIKMRLIKDRKLKNERTENMSVKSDEPGGTNLCQKRQNDAEKVSKLSFADCGRTQQKEKCKSNNDNDLIDQINKSFEDYFKSIVKVNVSSAKNEILEVEEETSSGEDEAESETESEKTSASALKFITQLLSMLASLSHSSEVPPLSMTINFGNGKITPSVQFNLQPGRNVPNRKRRSKKLTINNFDGPADSSSSEDSVEGKSTPRTPCKKRLKKDIYRPLNVVIQKTPGSGLSERKRKLPSRNISEEVNGGSTCSDVFPTPRRSGDTEAPAGLEPEGNTGSKQEVQIENLTRFGEGSGGSKQFFRFHKTVTMETDSSPVANESDFIWDSEDENVKRLKKKRKMRRRLWKSKKTRVETLKVPQTDMVSSSEGEESAKNSKSKQQKVTKIDSHNEERIISFYDKTDKSYPGGEVKDMGLIIPMNEVIGSLDEELSSHKMKDCSQWSSDAKSSPLSKSLFDLSEDFTTDMEKIAVNSDDSLKKENSPEREREITPFELSGSFLHKERSPIKSQLSGICLLSTPSPTDKDTSGQWKYFLTEDILTVSGEMTILPKLKPPSYREVEATLSNYNIAVTVAQAPFYSDAKDISKYVEVGGRVLKIENYSIAGLKTHVSEIGLTGTEERRTHLLNVQKKGMLSMRSILVEKRETCITPLARPPTWREVAGWSEKADEVIVKEKTKTKVMMPKSPGQDSDTEDETDLSITISSPVSSGVIAHEELVVAGPSGLRPLSCGSSSSSSPLSFPEDIRHSTPVQRSASPDPLGLKKGPLHRIKGIKRMSLTKKLQTIAEESMPTIPTEKISTSRESKPGSDFSFGIHGVTVDNTFGFKSSVECRQNAKAVHSHEYITMLVIELHVQTRGSFLPDPEYDPIRAVFYTLITDNPEQTKETGVIVVGENVLAGTAPPPVNIDYVLDENALLEKFLELLRFHDPDILAGYEIEMQSWGYLFQRSFKLDKNLYFAASRIIDENQNWKKEEENVQEVVPEWIRNMKITGRIVLDIWRVLRHEIALTSYTFENIMYHLLHERHPKHSYQTLNRFWEHPSHRYRYITLQYYINRTEGIVKLLDHLDFISRNCELARLFGIQFFEVLSRGSQFRVESMMLRLAKPLNYVSCSPSIKQRADMRAPASLPLIMEPESMFYADPIIVLDFQSLYPSMIIAYNYCFSTCLGRVEKLGGREPFEFGCTQLQISPEELKALENDVNISPAGVAFVRSNVRKGVLPSMLEEILETRLMVKKSMKENKSNKILQKVLHARQLGLKLIANVTYGYTAANFSGRMPCIEVGDSVVSKGRETLQRAIEMVKNTSKWGAKVVYGDTDSLFVLTPGKTRQEAFLIGNEIAEAVTRDNPKPVKLKLEKVYQPSILQTKKRYVGYMYETPDQQEPVYDAKGIETVRRDGCPATAKILQKALQILFEKKDVSQVKKYTIRQFAKLFQGRVNVQDLIFAKEYRGRRGYRAGACVPALELAKRWTQVDRRAEPRVKERVPYVVVNGPPGLPLIRLVRSPSDLLSDHALRINANYYITKAIVPAMQRCFSLLGVDVMSWYAEMPRKYQKMLKPLYRLEGQKKSTISQYFETVNCTVCSQVTNIPVCHDCKEDKQKMAVVLHEKIRKLEKNYHGVRKICSSCCGRTFSTECDSLDCPVLYRLHQIDRDFEQVETFRQMLHTYLD